MDIYTYKGYALPMRMFAEYLKGIANGPSALPKAGAGKKRASKAIAKPLGLEKELALFFLAVSKLKSDNQWYTRELIRELTGRVLQQMGMTEDDVHEDKLHVFSTHRTHGSELGLGKWVIALVTEDYKFSPTAVKLFVEVGAEEAEWTKLSV